MHGDCVARFGEVLAIARLNSVDGYTHCKIDRWWGEKACVERPLSEASLHSCLTCWHARHVHHVHTHALHTLSAIAPYLH